MYVRDEDGSNLSKVTVWDHHQILHTMSPMNGKMEKKIERDSSSGRLSICSKCLGAGHCLAGHRMNFPQGTGCSCLPASWRKPSDSRHYPLINLPPLLGLLTVCLVCLESLVSLPRKPRLSPDYCALIHPSLDTWLVVAQGKQSQVNSVPVYTPPQKA